MADQPPTVEPKPSLFERMGNQPSPALAARLGSSGSFVSSTTTGFPASSTTAPVFAVPVSKKPKVEHATTSSPNTSSGPSTGNKFLPLAELLERARAATERQQLDLADHYFSLASSHYGSRFTKESVLDHASVLLLLGESARAASLAASLADSLAGSSQSNSSLYERAVYVQGAALLAAQDYAGCKHALTRGMVVFPHSQQMKETLAEAESELAASLAGVSSNESMTIRLLCEPPIDVKPTFTLQYFDNERITSVASPAITIALTPVTLKANVNVHHGAVLQAKAFKKDNITSKLVDVFGEGGTVAELQAQASQDDLPSDMRLVTSYDISGGRFGIYTGSCASAECADMMAGMNALVPWFIDGGTIIDHEDPAWSFFAIFKLSDAKIESTSTAFESTSTSHKPIVFVGFVSVYRMFAYPDKLKQRICQFLVLPPFQRQGHGSKMMECVLGAAASDDEVKAVSFEDATDDLALLRDRVHLRTLVAKMSSRAQCLQLSPTKIMDLLKVEKQQANRILDIIGLSCEGDSAIETKTRLQIKQRVYKKVFMLKGRNSAAEAAVEKMMANSEAAIAQTMLAKMDPAAASAPPPSKSGDIVDTHNTLDMAYRRVVSDLAKIVQYAKSLQ